MDTGRSMRGRFAGNGALWCSSEADTLVVAGVCFMGESAKTLLP